MNLNNNPTKDQFKAILEAADDSAGHNVLWVSSSGDVRIDVLPSGITPAGWEGSFPTTQLRYETFVRGNGYVGPKAASDPAYVERLYNSLITEWSNRGPDPDFIDMF